MCQFRLLLWTSAWSSGYGHVQFFCRLNGGLFLQHPSPKTRHGLCLTLTQVMLVIRILAPPRTIGPFATSTEKLSIQSIYVCY